MSRPLTARCCAGVAGLLASVLVSAAALAAPATAPLVLTTGDDYPPYTGVSLPQGGLATDIVRQAFSKAGMEIRIEWLPWARGLYEAQSGDYAATFPYLHTPERDNAFLFSEPLLDLDETLFVRKGLLIDPQHLETLRGRIFCLPVGWAVTGRLETILRSRLITEVQPPDIGQCVKMMMAGHADFFPSDLRQGLTSLADAGVKGGEIEPLLPTLQASSVHLIVSRKQPGAADLIARFNRGLKSLRTDGSYDRLVQAHGIVPPQSQPVSPPQ